MAIFNVKLAFMAKIDIDAPDEEFALQKAKDILDTHSVYDDDAIDIMHDDAYCAGAFGGDPPLRKKRAYTMRNQDFEPEEPVIVWAIKRREDEDT